MAQPGESVREHVQEKAADELVGVETHDLDFVAMSVIAPAEADVLAVEVDQTVIGDCGFVRLWEPYGYGNLESQGSVMTRLFR